MNDVSTWVPVAREDGETVGYLDPVDPDYDAVIPRTVLGHAAGEPTDFLAGEELVAELGIGELAERWVLDADTDDEVRNLTIVELSPHGIRLADYLSSKALTDSSTRRIDWPDVDGRISRQD